MHAEDTSTTFPANSKYAPEPISILDSGCSTHISGLKSDFFELDSEPTIRITGVDGDVNAGKPVGIVGKMWPNNLGIQHAIFLPSFGRKRLISTTNLVTDGWQIIFSENSKARHKDGRVMQITVGDNLPTVEFKFLRDKCNLLNAGEMQRNDLLAARTNIVWPKEPSRNGTGRLHNNVNLADLQAMDDKEHEVEEQLPKVMVDEPVNGRPRMPRLKVDAALDLHRRLGHLYVPGNENVNCPECALSKGGRKPVVKVRGREYLSKDPLEQLNVDFYGPIRTKSRKGKKIIFVAICDSSGLLLVKPLKTRRARRQPSEKFWTILF